MLYGRMYTVVMDAIAVTGAKDLIRVSAPSTGIIVIHELAMSEESDAGDTEAEMLAAQWQLSSTDGTGTSATPEPHQAGMGTYAGTAVSNLTADTTLSTKMNRKAFNAQIGFHELFTPEMRPIVAPSARFVLRLDKAPADELTVSASITFEEIGG